MYLGSQRRARGIRRSVALTACPTCRALWPCKPQDGAAGDRGPWSTPIPLDVGRWPEGPLRSPDRRGPYNEAQREARSDREIPGVGGQGEGRRGSGGQGLLATGARPTPTTSSLGSSTAPTPSGSERSFAEGSRRFDWSCTPTRRVSSPSGPSPSQDVESAVFGEHRRLSTSSGSRTFVRARGRENSSRFGTRCGRRRRRSRQTNRHPVLTRPRSQRPRELHRPHPQPCVLARDHTYDASPSVTTLSQHAPLQGHLCDVSSVTPPSHPLPSPPPARLRPRRATFRMSARPKPQFLATTIRRSPTMSILPSTADSPARPLSRRPSSMGYSAPRGTPSATSRVRKSEAPAQPGIAKVSIDNLGRQGRYGCCAIAWWHATIRSQPRSARNKEMCRIMRGYC